ncbi:MAG: hypothetical protein ACRDCI_11985 [Plesiomonas shigelloides]
MKNGDMPAHPTGEVYFVGENGRRESAQSNGMTKREMMAMHAPSVPDWFVSMWGDEHIDSELYFDSCWVGSEYGGSITDKVMSNNGKCAMFFAWRVYYADQLLVELEVSK